MLSGGKATSEQESTHVAEIHRSHCSTNGNEPWIDRGEMSAAEQLALKRRSMIRHNHPPPSLPLSDEFVRNVQEASKRVNESSNKPIITSITKPSSSPTIEHKTTAPQIDVKVAQTNVQSADGDGFDLTIWDCGGQVEYYAAHQVLLSATSIFILLIDLTSKPSPSDRLIEWTRALYSRIHPQQLMVVFSKADLVKDDALPLVDDALKACAKNGLKLKNGYAIISNKSSEVADIRSLADVRSRIIAMCASHLRKLAKKRVCI